MMQRPLVALAGLVTGAASGIGASICTEVATQGARVALVDRSSQDIDAQVERLKSDGCKAISVVADVSDFQAMDGVANRCLQEFGRIDFAVANAGIGSTDSMIDGDTSRWRAVLETNVLGAAYTVRAVLPTMRSQRSGHIILMASLSGRETYVGEPIYIASKWALVGLGHSLRKEVQQLGIKVTLVEPGLVDTPMARSNPFAQALFGELHPLDPADVARVVAFSLSQPPHVLVSEIAIKPARQDI
jgi:NADP-dependent 3-hydroxy acid dehydrogenase YdfG